jgi:hypothetical protein
MFSKILHANDGSEGAFKALEVALSMARHYRSELHMVGVEAMPWLPGTREEVFGDKELANHKFEGVIARAKEQARKQRVRLTPHLLVGHPVKCHRRLRRPERLRRPGRRLCRSLPILQRACRQHRRTAGPAGVMHDHRREVSVVDQRRQP